MMHMIVFYDYKRVIFGKSQIMYKGKWYLVLYACEEYVIIRLRNKYVKLNKYDVEDCTYHNTIIDAKDETIRLRNYSELQEVIREGEMVIARDYDIDEIEACKQDMELYKSDNFKLFFLSGMLTRINLYSDNEELNRRFTSFVIAISNLPIGCNRRGINIIVVDSFESRYYSMINMLLNKYSITTDADAIRCLSYRFIIDLLYIIEGD